MTLTQAVLACLMSLVPPSRAPRIPGWEETTNAARARYASIAEDIAAVSETREDAALLVGIAVHESALRPDVDADRCYHGPGHDHDCDAGLHGDLAHSIWQLQLVPRGITRREAARIALARARWSQRRCARLEPALQLASFASGSAACAMGWDTSRSLAAHVQRALANMPATE